MSFFCSTAYPKFISTGYGSAYRDINTLAIIHNDLAGNTVCDHLLGTVGYAFLTGHVALNNMLEQSLQVIEV